MKAIFASAMAFLLIGFSAEGAALPFPGQDDAPKKTPTTGSESQSATPEARRAAPTFAFGLEDATPVKLKLARELSSEHEKVGDRVDFEVVENVKVKDVVVVPKGGIAWGTITEAQPHRRMGRAGKLDLKIDEVRLVDGERIPLRAEREAKGSGRQGLMTVGIVGSGLLFFPAAPLFLFMHGKDITIPKGAEVTGYIAGDTALDRQKFASGPQPQDASPASATTPAPVTATPTTPMTTPAMSDAEGNTPK